MYTYIMHHILTKDGKVMLSGYLLITGVMSVSCGALRGTRDILCGSCDANGGFFLSDRVAVGSTCDTV